MCQINSKIIQASNYKNTRWITFEIEIPKFLNAQMNTHRMLVKNYQSSRAVPTEQVMKQDFYIPENVFQNQPGMAGSKPVENYQEFVNDYKDICQKIMDMQLALKNKYNVHKQHLRFGEPFTMQKGVISGTYEDFMHMIALRSDSHAQPEFQELANQMAKQLNTCHFNELLTGDFHLPYVNRICNLKNKEDCLNGIMESASAIAQVSYRKLDLSLDKAVKVFSRLQLTSKLPHVSAIQHIVMAAIPEDLQIQRSESRNFSQLSKLLAAGHLKFDDDCRLIDIINK